MSLVPLHFPPSHPPACLICLPHLPHLPHLPDLPTPPARPPAGILADEIVEPMPPLLRALCRRLTRWGVMPAAREPNSAIINIYEPVSLPGVGCGVFNSGLSTWKSGCQVAPLCIPSKASPT